jgi:hypothetical protein
MNDYQESILAQMGIKPIWRLRAAPEGLPQMVDLSIKPEQTDAPRMAPGNGLDGVGPESVLNAQSFDMQAEEVRPVSFFKDVSVGSDCLIINGGGAPSSEQASQLLDAMLAAIALKRGDKLQVVDGAESLSIEQIGAMRPRLIVALGQEAGQRLLGDVYSLESSRKTLLSFEGIPVIVTYDPQWLLRNPKDKAGAWEDLCFMQDQMQRLATLN